jgi:hypothetical protein
MKHACTMLAVVALWGCSRPAAIAHDPAPESATRCVGEEVPVDLAAAKVPYVNGVAVAGDGTIAAVVGQSGEASSHVDGADGIVVWGADGAVKERYRMYAWHVAFAKDGRLAFSSSDESGVLDRRTGCARTWKIRGPLLRFRADGALVIAGDGRVRAVDAESGAIVAERALEGPVALDVASGRVAVLDGAHGLHLLPGDLSSQRDVVDASDGLGNGQVVSIAPSGAWVAAGATERYPVTYPKWTKPGSPFRHRLMVRTVALPAGTEIERFESDAYALAYAPDSATLAVADDRVLSLRAVAENGKSKVARVLDDKVSFAQQLAWSSDGARLVLADWRGAVRVYDVATGAVRVLAP